MTDKQAADTLLSVERDICGRIHNAITEILRKGYENGSTDGEFRIVWDDIGIQLRAYDDSWEVLSHMPELIDLMGRIQIEELKPTIKEFAEMLKGIGFKDITKHQRKD